MSHRGYIGQVFEVRPILEGMEDRGVPIDDAARLALDAEFDKAQEEILAEIQSKVPEAALRLHPKDGYKGIPPEIKAIDPIRWQGAAADFFLDARFKEKDATKPDGSIDEGEWYRYAKKEFAVPVIDADSGGPALKSALRWCRVYDFNPNSRNQVIAYMKAKGHTVPKDRHREDAEGNNPDTTAEKELRRLASKTGDLLYLRIIDYRGLTKMRGTYIKGFEPGSDGCVHTTFTFDTSIGQLSSRNPNVQNFPKLKPTPQLAKAMRRMISAKPGNILTEWDYKSFHVLTLGFMAEDPVWMRLARLDMHSFFAGYMLGIWDTSILSESDEQLMDRFKWLKSDPERKRIRDDQSKHGILGVGNGLKENGLFERYMENFPPHKCKLCEGSGKVQGVRGLKKCPPCKGIGMLSGRSTTKEILQALQRMSPKIFAYQDAECKMAHDTPKGVMTIFGFMRKFFEVFRWNHDRGDWGPGDQHEEAVSFRHTNIAHCEVRLRMKELDSLGFAKKYGMFNQIHDALKFHFPEPMLEEHIHDVYPVLAAPSLVIRHPSICPDGLVIGVEGSWGYRWSDMKEIEIPKSFGSTIPAEVQAHDPGDASGSALRPSLGVL